MASKKERELVREARFWAAQKKVKEKNRAALKKMGLSTNVYDQCWLVFEATKEAEQKEKREKKFTKRGDVFAIVVNWRLPAKKRRRSRL